MFGKYMWHEAVVEVHIHFSFETLQMNFFITVSIHRFRVLPESLLWTKKAAERWNGAPFIIEGNYKRNGKDGTGNKRKDSHNSGGKIERIRESWVGSLLVGGYWPLAFG